MVLQYWSDRALENPILHHSTTPFWCQPAKVKTALLRIHCKLPAVILCLMLAGCKTPANLREMDPASAPRIETTDSFKVQEIVYGYLLQRDLWSTGEYTAVFLKASDAEFEAFLRKFPNHVPRLKSSDRLRLRGASSPTDKETGRPAMVLAALASDTDGDHVEAIGTYFAGPMVSGKYVFRLRKRGSDWAIESVK